MNKKWYLAKMIYRIVCGTGHHKPQFDEQLRLVAACDTRQAFDKATELGKKEEDVFPNQKLQLVRWQFINVSEIHELHDLADGAELYSAVQEVENADAFITFVHHKARQLAGSEPLLYQTM